MSETGEVPMCSKCGKFPAGFDGLCTLCSIEAEKEAGVHDTAKPPMKDTLDLLFNKDEPETQAPTPDKPATPEPKPTQGSTFEERRADLLQRLRLAHKPKGNEE